MKQFVRNAVLSALGLSAVVLAGCSKAGLDAPVSPVVEGDEITLGAEFAVPTVASAANKAGSVLSRGVIDKGYAGPLFVSFARLDQDETSGSYPADYSAVDSAFLASWQGPLAPTLDDAGADNGQNATVIKFCDPKFYLSRASNNNTKLVGWYPAYATQTALGTGGALDINIDGETDIMLTEELEANKTLRFGNFKAADDADNRIFHFRHQLTQLRVYAYAVNANAPTVWGKIKSIKFKDQSPTCHIVLPATVSYTGTAANLPLVEKKVSDDSDISYGSDGLAFTFDSSIAVGSADEQANRERSAVEYGYALIAPVATTGQLTLIIDMENGGEQSVSVPVLPVSSVNPTPGGFQSGYAYNIYLRFSAVTIEPKATISEWQSGGDVSIEM